MYDKVLCRVGVHALYEGQRPGIYIRGIGHPEYIPGPVRDGIHNSGTKCYWFGIRYHVEQLSVGVVLSGMAEFRFIARFRLLKSPE